MKQVLTGILDLPENGTIGFDDIFIAGQHLPVVPRVGVARRASRWIAELHLVDLRDLGKQYGLDRIGQVEVETGLRRVDPLTESQNNALLVGLNPIDHRRKPSYSYQRGDQPQASSIDARQADEFVQLVLRDRNDPAQITTGRADGGVTLVRQIRHQAVQN